MASVNRPLSRRYGIRLSYLEPISYVESAVPLTEVFPVTYPVVVNERTTAELVFAGAYVTEATVTGVPLDGAALTLAGAYAVSAYTGSLAEITSPSLTLTASGTVPNLARAELTATTPYVVTSSASVSGSSSAVLSLQSAYDVSAYTGAQTTLEIQPFGYVTTASVMTGSAIVAELVAPSPYILTTSATPEGVASAVLTGPALQATPYNSAWLTLPSLTMYATVSEVVTVTYEAYAINLSTGVVTHYTNYPFDDVLRFGNKYYGVAPTGLFEIGGSLDITTAIDAHVKTFSTKLGSSKMKRVPYVYSSGRSDGGVLVGVTADEGETYSYESDWGEVPGSTNHRTVVGKGIRGVYYALDIQNIGGSSLELDGVKVDTELTERAI